MFKKFAAIAAGLLFALSSYATQQIIVTTPGVATTAPNAGTIINANFSELYGFFRGQLYVLASGDITGATDLADLQAAIATMTASKLLPSGAGEDIVGNRIIF